jgi:NitT/TauT family transport system substrate-binding protein
MNTRLGLALAIAAIAALASPPLAAADDVIKLTIGQRGNWDTAVSQLGTKAGIFKKNGITLEMIYTSGSG